MGCPSDRELAEFVARAERLGDHAQIEEHLAGCQDCRRLAFALAVDRELPGGVSESRIGRFEILSTIGQGAMGQVHLALDPELNRQVALKLRRTRARLDDESEVRLRREAQALARLIHPNVVTVFELGRHQQTTYVVMEFVDGVTLDRWLASPRAPGEVIELLLGAARGLEAAHAAGLVHRDIKPSNIFVTPAGIAKVGDFGLVRVTSGATVETDDEPVQPGASSMDATLPLSAAGSLVGTPAYMAPEQLEGEVATERSDQFSFCVMMWEALAGRRPFEGATVRALLGSISEGPDVSALPAVPVRVRDALVRGLARAPDQRFSSMSELVVALRGRAAGRRWIALAGGIGGAALVFVAALEVVARRSPASVAWPGVASATLRGGTTAPRRDPLREATAASRRDATAVVAWLKGRGSASATPDGAADPAVELAVRAEDAGIAQHVLAVPDGDHPRATCLAADGSQVAVVTARGALWRFDLGARTRHRITAPGAAALVGCRFMRRDRELMFWAASGAVFRSALDGQPVQLVMSTRAPLPIGDDHVLIAPPDGPLQLVELATGRARAISMASRPTNVAAPPTGDPVYAIDPAGLLVRIPAVGPRTSTAIDRAGTIEALTIGGDGRMVIAVGDEAIAAHDTSTGARYRLAIEASAAPVHAQAIGELVVVIQGRDRALWVWRPRDGARRQLADQARPETLRLAEGPRPRAYWASSTGQLHMAELGDGFVRAVGEPRGALHDVALSASGAWLAVADDVAVRVYRAPAPARRAIHVAGGSRFVRPLHDASGLVFVEASHRLARMEVDTLAVTQLEAFAPEVVSMVSAAGQAWVAVCLSDGHVVLRSSAAARATRRELGIPGGCAHLAAPDDETLVVLGRDGTLHAVDVRGATARSLGAFGGAFAGAVRFLRSRNGQTVIGMSMRTITLLERATGEVSTMPDQGMPLFGLDFSADGRTIAFGLPDGRVQRFDRATGAVRAVGRLSGLVNNVLLMPDDAAVIASDEAGHVVQLSLTGAPARPLMAVGARLAITRVSASGRWLVGGEPTGGLVLMNLATGHYARLSGHTSEPRAIGFLGGHAMYSFDQAGELAIWDLEAIRLVPVERDGLASWLDAATSAVIDGDGDGDGDGGGDGALRTPLRDEDRAR